MIRWSAKWSGSNIFLHKFWWFINVTSECFMQSTERKNTKNTKWRREAKEPEKNCSKDAQFTLNISCNQIESFEDSQLNSKKSSILPSFQLAFMWKIETKSLTFCVNKVRITEKAVIFQVLTLKFEKCWELKKASFKLQTQYIHKRNLLLSYEKTHFAQQKKRKVY